MGPGRSSVLRIGSNPAKASSPGRTDGGKDSLAVVVHWAASRERPFSLDKGKGKINKIQYPRGSEYLRAAIQNVEAMGPNRVKPLYGEIFAARYGPSFGVQVWCSDVLTTYAIEVPKMVCFFEVAFETPLPLASFYKKGSTTFQCLPLSAFPQLLGCSGGAVSRFQGQRLGCSQYCPAFRLLQSKGRRRRLSLYLQVLQC